MPLQSPENMHETPVDRLRDVVAGWIDAVATQGEKAYEAFGKRAPGSHWVPGVDVVESEDQVQVLVDLPGVDSQKVEILLTGNMLTIKGERPPVAPAEATVHRRERAGGAFCRSVPLPVAVDPERVAAASHHGVLTVTLAKEEKVRPRHIPVQTTD